MEQKIIVAGIVIAALAYMLFRLRKSAGGKGCGCGCACGVTGLPAGACANNRHRKQQQ